MSPHLTRLLAAFMATGLLGRATPLSADEINWVDRFQLGNVCEPVDLIVEAIDRNEKAVGLTYESIITTVRARLRAARLYHSDSRPYLYVNVHALPPAFAVRVAFYKPLSDPISGWNTVAITWEKAVIGKGADADYILSRVAQLTDKFIDEYLRVNAPACGGTP